MLADNDSTGVVRVDCTLKSPANSDLDLSKLRLDPTGPPNKEFSPITVASAVTLVSAGTINLDCSVPEGTATQVTFGFRSLIATRVATLTLTP